MVLNGETRSRRRRGMFRAALLLLIATAAQSRAAEPRVTIMVSGIEKQIYLPAKLTEQLGYFKDEGIDVELLTVPGGMQAENAMLAGEVQGVVGFYDHTIDLQAKGEKTLSVVQFGRTPGEMELVDARKADRIRSPADLAGKTLGVTGLGSSTSFLTLYLAARNGIPADQLQLLPVGVGNTFMTALEQGRIDVGMTTDPTASVMISRGQARIILDLRSPDETRAALGSDYPSASLYMQTGWVETHRPVAQKIANALVRTMTFIAGHNGAEIAARMPRDFYAGDRATYIRALDDGKNVFTPDGRMPAGGPESVLKILQTVDKTVHSANIALAETYTNEFVDAAIKAGKAKPVPKETGPVPDR